MIAVMMIMVDFVPSDTDSSPAEPDHTICLDNIESTPGATWDDETNTLTFGSDANSFVFLITQTNNAQQSMDIVFTDDVATIVIISGINMKGDIELQGNASVTILLGGSNKIDGSILVPEYASVVFDSADSPGGSKGVLAVTATNGIANAGIGGAQASAVNNGNSGSITINGGTITSLGGRSYAVNNNVLGLGAGIGGGGGSDEFNAGNNGIVTINGGIVTAKNGSAGIGGGGTNINYKNGGYGGNITITGGTVTVTGSYGAGIGGGEGRIAGDGGNITISGNANVTAYGGGSCPGIGGAGGGTKNGNGGNTTITDNAVVVSKAGSYAAGIGGGFSMMVPGGAGGVVSITGYATVLAVGGDWGGASDTVGFGGAGIGGGDGIGAPDGMGAILTISDTASVVAVAAGVLPAIHAVSVSGDGNFVNATFGQTISKTKKVEIHVYAENSGNLLDIISLPANYWNFAYSTGAARTDNVYVYLSPTDIRSILVDGGVNDDSKEIQSTNTTAVLPVKLGDVASYIITLDDGMTNGTIQWSLDEKNWYSFQANNGKQCMAFLEIVGTVHLKAVGKTGYEFDSWTGDIAGDGSNPFQYTEREDMTVGAVFVLAQVIEEEPEDDDDPVPNVPNQNEKRYYITASADAGSTISPKGTTVLGQGEDKTYIFSLIEGYCYFAVKVDGVPLTEEQMLLGHYTFRNVVSNHTIEVESMPDTTVPVPPVVGDEGSGPVDNSMNDGNDVPIWWVLIVGALALGLLLWFFFYRRYYEVTKVESSATIVGDDRVHRKSKYVFSVTGAFSGTVSYRIGEDGERKVLLPGLDGLYVIPRGEITDKVTLEYR